MGLVDWKLHGELIVGFGVGLIVWGIVNGDVVVDEDLVVRGDSEVEGKYGCSPTEVNEGIADEPGRVELECSVMRRERKDEEESQNGEG